jgi:voltage-gated sodium channel
MTGFARRIVDSRIFQTTIIIAILMVAMLAGLETDASIVASHGPLLSLLDAIIFTVFIAEILLKFATYGRRPLDFFHDGWNVFDFTVVALCLLPGDSQFAVVLRLARTLRLLRLVSALPKLQLLVGALIKSFSSMGYVGLLLCLIFYIYAVSGVHLFGAHDPAHFGTMKKAFFTLFQTITLDDWKFLYESAKGSSPAITAVYFISFILLGTMIMLNLFIGIIMSSMEEMHSELDEYKSAKHGTPDTNSALRDLDVLDEQVVVLKNQISELRIKLTKEKR